MERWRGTVTVGPRARRRLVITDDAIEVTDPAGVVPPVVLDLRKVAERGLLLPGTSTMTVVDGRGVDATRLQMRAVPPATFEEIAWPDDVREHIEAQRERDRAASLKLRRQLGTVVAVTIAALGALLLVLVIVLLLG